jgi:hypothetical protein
MMSLKPDIDQALYFLDLLRPNGRHTIASEAPFGGKDNGPRWEVGATYEAHQRDYLINDIKERQIRGSNVYYSVNHPCKVSERQGFYGKNNIDDIIAINALGFDIDVLMDKQTVLGLINEKLDGELKPSMVISTGGGYHLIYLLIEPITTKLFRPPKTDKEKDWNDAIIYNRSNVTLLAQDFEHMLRNIFPTWKIDSMSNVDRVLRLPGTVNYPKAEKIAKGQVPAMAHIMNNYERKCCIQDLRKLVPQTQSVRSQEKRPFIPSPNSKWTAYLKAKWCCEFIKENKLADSNEIYTKNVMLPLIGAIHDENKYNQITIEEAEELFMEAISGGERYGTMGRGQRYFMRQWRSHRPEIKRVGTKSLGGLIWFVKENGGILPWVVEEVEMTVTHVNVEDFKEWEPYSEKF